MITSDSVANDAIAEAAALLAAAYCRCIADSNGRRENSGEGVVGGL